MSPSSTPSGAFIVPRAITSDELWDFKPAWWFKVWFYILAKANFKDHNNRLKRGDLFTTYELIHYECHLATEGVKKDSIDNVLRYLKSRGHITTRRTTRGLIITVLNYDQLQDFASYSNGTENVFPEDIEKIPKRPDKEINEINETNNNYLKKSISYKEEKTLSKSQPKSKTQPEVVFRSQLKKIKAYYDDLFISRPDVLEENELSPNTTAAVNGIIYYINKYKFICGIDHPYYKKKQLEDCFLWFLNGIWDIEQANLAVEETIRKVIDRWFYTTNPHSNNLKLSHFVGKGSLVFWNSLQGVIVDLGVNREEENADS